MQINLIKKRELIDCLENLNKWQMLMYFIFATQWKSKFQKVGADLLYKKKMEKRIWHSCT